MGSRGEDGKVRRECRALSLEDRKRLIESDRVKRGPPPLPRERKGGTGEEAGGIQRRKRRRMSNWWFVVIIPGVYLLYILVAYVVGMEDRNKMRMEMERSDRLYKELEKINKERLERDLQRLRNMK